MPSVPVTLDIGAAARRIAGRIERTPLRRSAWLGAASGAEVLLKLETLQPTFSYKIRGALNAVLRLDGDLYESTMDSLIHAYAKVSRGGFGLGQLAQVGLQESQAPVGVVLPASDLRRP